MAVKGIVHCKRELFDVYIGRGNGSIWGNPFQVSPQMSRDECIARYREWLPKQKELMARLGELDNKILGCWCKTPESPNTPCHGDVLAEFVLGLRKTTYKLAVIGSRTFDDKERLYRILDKNEFQISMIVSGNADGADFLGQQWAIERGIPLLIFPAKWRDKEGNYDRGAGFKRNRLIVQHCDKVLACWDKTSRGTANSLEWAAKMNKPVTYVYFKPKENIAEKAPF